MRDFISEHKRLSIGIILYIIVFIVSIFYSPWSIDSMAVGDITSTAYDSVIDKIPANMLFFGIYELCELFVYADHPDVFHGDMVMFALASCAVFSFAKIIQDFILKFDPSEGFNFDLDFDFEFESEEGFNLEKVTNNFLYDNIFAYLCCVIMYNTYSPIAGKVSGVFEVGSFWAKAAAVLLILCFVIVPALPQILQFLLYIFSVSMLEKLLNYMDSSISWNIFFKTIVIFAAAIVLLFVMNYILSKVSDFVMSVFKVYFPMALAYVATALIGVLGYVVLIALVIVLIIVVLSKVFG